MKLLRRAANLAISAALVVISAVNKMLQHRHAGTVFRTAGALMFTVMAIGLFPAASEVMLVAPEGGAAVEKAAEARPQIMVIYRDTPGSEWALAAARRLAAELSDRYNYEAVLTPATQVGFGDPDDEGGAIVIGHTDLSESDYADAYYAVGANGCRTYFNSRGDLIIESFGSEGAEAGIDLFLTNYNGDAASAVVQRSGVDVPDLDAVLSNYGGFDYSSASQDDSSAVELKTDSDDGEFRTLVLASPDSNAYSVRAVSALLDSTKPDFVVFMGDLSSGASDRASLIGAWDTIIAPVNERGIGWSFVRAAEDDSREDGLSGVIINEVISARAGCIDIGDGAAFISMNGSNGKAIGRLCIVGDGTAKNSYVIAEKMAKYSSDGVPCALIVSDEIEKGESKKRPEHNFGNMIASIISGKSSFEQMVSAGLKCVVTCGDSGDTGVSVDDGVIFAAAGSVGFEAPGRGGSFSYNNSLRGGLLVTLGGTAGAGEFTAKYIYTADLGVNER